MELVINEADIEVKGSEKLIGQLINGIFINNSFSNIRFISINRDFARSDYAHTLGGKFYDLSIDNSYSCVQGFLKSDNILDLVGSEIMMMRYQFLEDMGIYKDNLVKLYQLDILYAKKTDIKTNRIIFSALDGPNISNENIPIEVRDLEYPEWGVHFQLMNDFDNQRSKHGEQ